MKSRLVYYDVGFFLCAMGTLYAMMELPQVRAVGLILLALLFILWGALHAEPEITAMLDRDDQDGEL